MAQSLPDLADLAVFAHVAGAGSFTRGAARAGLTKGAVSKSVARLESHLGARLLVRTTRQLSLTEAGEALVVRARRMLEEAEAGAAAVANLAAAPRGTLRINAPAGFGEAFVVPLVPTLLAKYPGLRIELSLDDRTIDPVAGGFDVTVRVGRLVDSSLTVRTLAPAPLLAVASPEYLARRGVPQKPADLAKHDCLHYTLVPLADEWSFRIGRRVESAPVTTAFAADHGRALREAALRGAGLAMLPSFYVVEELRSGRLSEVLASYRPPVRSVIHVLLPRGRTQPPKVRVFVDELARSIALAGLDVDAK